MGGGSGYRPPENDNKNNTPENAENGHTHPAPISLPNNIETLVNMRDALEDYLSTVERNVDNVSEWLAQHKKEILLQNYALYRAIVLNQNEKEALNVLNNMGDTKGFVLSVQDFEKIAGDHLGKDIVDEIKKIKKGLPEYLLEPLPEIDFPKVDMPTPAPVTQEPTAEKKSSGGGIWPFNGAAKKAEREKQEAENKARELRKRLQQARNDLVALQSDKHYYIDSFMDWIGESLAPEETIDVTDNTYVMEHYQDPQYMIRQAQADLSEVLDVYTQNMRIHAQDYTRIAEMMDKKQVQNICDELFPTDANQLHPQSVYFKSLILEDFKKYGDTFADIAMNYFKKPADIMTFLSHVSQYETPLKINHTTNPADIFETVLNTFLDKDYKDPRVLTDVLVNLQTSPKFDLNDVFFDKGNVFERLNEFYTKKDDYDTFKNVLKSILCIQGNDNLGYVDHTVNFIQALNNADRDGIRKELNYLKSAGRTTRDQFQSLLDICMPTIHYDTLLDTLTSVADIHNDYTFLSTVIDSALDIGLLGELNEQDYTSATRMKSFMQNTVLPHAQDFDISTIGSLVLYTLDNQKYKDLTGYRDTLENNWLDIIADHSKLFDTQKTKWIAAFLEPFSSDFVKANILITAAEQSKTAKSKKFLTDLESTLITENVRLSKDKLLTNLNQIANIWYNDDTHTMHYTVGGVTHILMENIPSHDAAEILDVLQRKGQFAEEYNGLLQPKNIEKILTNNTHGTRMGWQHIIGNMNADKNLINKIHKHDDFLHATHNDQTLSIRLDSIAMIQKIAVDKWVVLDQYGQEEVLNNDIKFDQNRFVQLDTDIFLNPDAVAILSLDTGDDKISFRIESQEFDNFLTQYGTDSFFYTLPLPKGAAKKALQDARQTVQRQHFISSSNHADETLYFNIAKLGYMSLQDKKQTGFMCQSVGMRKNGGFISTEDRALADGIVKDFEKSGKTLQIGHTFIHAGAIENMYYNPESKKLYTIIGKDMLDFDIPQTEAFDILSKLSKQSGFAVSGMLEENGQKKISDVISLSRATYMFYAKSQEKIYLSYETNKTYINIDSANAYAFFNSLEEEKRPTVTTGLTLKDASKNIYLSDHTTGINYAEVKPDVSLEGLLKSNTSGKKPSIVAFVSLGNDMTHTTDKKENKPLVGKRPSKKHGGFRPS